ncbi:Signal recognition particle-docking protein FtsY [Pararhodospirillum photometricum DSM 122]|uniref:Signal recognition particle-docking protein FtsY n=1 Tax=Pararhodospirillum photometricum DSM 122 TaxID=1150469 RepID=H6SK41_PARPM|nr:Signal recognition particle-docking protein FtsY [Pararhodospirillum photometricum DSM 122]
MSDQNAKRERRGFWARILGPQTFDEAGGAGRRQASSSLPMRRTAPSEPAERERWQRDKGVLGNLLGPVAFGFAARQGRPLPPVKRSATVRRPVVRPERWDPAKGFWGNIFGPTVFDGVETPAPEIRPALGRVHPVVPPVLTRAPQAEPAAPISAEPVVPTPLPSQPLPPLVLDIETRDLAPLVEEVPAVETPAVEEPTGFFARLRDGLSRSSSRLAGGITSLFTQRKLDAAALEDLEDLLITGDLGAETASRLVQNLSRNRFGKEISGDEIREFLAAEIATILEPVAQPLVFDPSLKPHVVLVVGVNGSGKTTTIGKIANQLVRDGHKIMLAAGDTFRAAAVEQLKVWGERTGCPVIARDTGADAAGLAYDALERARAEGVDVLLIDTAGRLHNKMELMEELKKVVRVLRKIDPQVPHTVLQVLDATVGQNAHQQVKVFQEMVDVSGLVMTKLDGTAKGAWLWRWPIASSCRSIMSGWARGPRISGPSPPPISRAA